jgi:hypothetical protein
VFFFFAVPHSSVFCQTPPPLFTIMPPHTGVGDVALTNTAIRPPSGQRRRGAPPPGASASRVGLLSDTGSPLPPDVEASKGGGRRLSSSDGGALRVTACGGGKLAPPAPGRGGGGEPNPGLLRAVPQWWRVAKLWFTSERERAREREGERERARRARRAGPQCARRMRLCVVLSGPCPPPRPQPPPRRVAIRIHH